MDNIDLIRKIAWSFHNTTGLDWDDLFQEAAYAYCVGMQTYDAEKSKISTHMWHCITNHLRNYIREQQGPEFIPLEALERTTAPSSNFLDTLSKDAYYIAQMVLRASKKYVVRDLEDVEDRIITLLVQRGWSPVRISTALIDLETACTT